MQASFSSTSSYLSTYWGRSIVAVNGAGVFLDFMWVADAAPLNQVTANSTVVLPQHSMPLTPFHFLHGHLHFFFFKWNFESTYLHHLVRTHSAAHLSSLPLPFLALPSLSFLPFPLRTSSLPAYISVSSLVLGTGLQAVGTDTSLFFPPHGFGVN